MSEFFVILGLALLPPAGNFLGGLVAEVSRPSPRMVSLALHAAVGLIFAIIATELLPEAGTVLSGWAIGVAFILGAILYMGAESIAGRLSGTGTGSKRMWLVYAAVMIDMTSDGIMIGSSGAVAIALALKLGAGQVLADMPEGYAASSSLQSNDVPRGKRLLLMASLVVPAVGAALFTHFVLRGTSEFLRFGALAVISGMLALAAIEDMLGEAHAHCNAKWSALAFAGGFALFVFVTAGLEFIQA